jgi:tnp2 family transposase
MPRPRKKHIQTDRSEITDIGPKTRDLVECKCMLHCNGSKLVDPRTFRSHRREAERLRAIASGSQSTGSTISRPVDVGSSTSMRSEQEAETSMRRSVQEAEESQDSSNGYSSYSSDKSDQAADRELIDKPTKRKRYSKFRDRMAPVPDVPDDNDGDNETEVSSDTSGGDSAVEDDRWLSDDELPVEQFTAPDWDNLDFDSDNEDPDPNLDFNDSWILLWILKYQARFRLSDVAIDSLIKFFRIVLLDANHERFKDFPTSSYMMRKLLEIGKQSKKYAVCPSCNKLYNISTISLTSGLKCDHVEFPNHPKGSKRKPCRMEITESVPVTNGHIRKPKMIYPLPSLKKQIITMYRRPGFESLLRKWANRDSEVDLFTDIYDGEIWKTFPSNTDDSEPQRFFTPNTADSHLGIMINLDWFQPFDSASYSTGAIYGVICNLPREVRFKKENMLILALLPGPNEVKLHKINHYLAPIVDELLEFWNGIDLPLTEDHPEGKKIRLAVICCANDIPAARKLCGHISALSACHRCYKRANISGKKSNYGGFDDISEWFRERDLEEHRQNAEAWRRCKSEDERRRHVSTTLVRWSEMLRLPYFNPIRHLIIDPMHCLFLGIAHWIVKRLWIEGGKITKSNLELMESRAKKIKLPADMGRIPYKIATGEGFSGFTADQWKSFILIYAIPLMWDLLDDPDRKILSNFVKACSLLTCRIIDNNMLNDAHNRLHQVACLIEEEYGQEVITPNIHLSLHIAECCKDYGPLYSFWCYSFERMNGLLGKF